MPTHPRSLASVAVAVSGLFAALCTTSATAGAQQYVVEDAAIVDFGACQIEAWHGERESWMEPACQAIGNLELTAGAGFLDNGAGAREVAYLFEAKTLFRPLQPDDVGAGLFFGTVTDADARPEDVYGLGVVSASLGDDDLVLHGNVGWIWHRADGNHGLFRGLRADAAVGGPFSLIGEIYGEGRENPEYQLGIRTSFPEAGVELDFSWGAEVGTGQRAAGFTVGIAIISLPFL